MKKTGIIILTAVVGLFFAFRAIEKSEWTIDKSHSKLNFSVSHLMVSDVDGSFKDFDAKITTSKEDFSDAVVSITADVNSINTGIDKRDTHLKSADFFDAAKYPKMTFISKTFTKIDDKNYKVTGDLTMHGVTKPVVLNAFARTGTNPMSKKSVVGFKVTGEVKRLDFGVGTGSPKSMIGDEVAIVANLEVEKS